MICQFLEVPHKNVTCSVSIRAHEDNDRKEKFVDKDLYAIPDTKHGNIEGMLCYPQDDNINSINNEGREYILTESLDTDFGTAMGI